MAENYTLHWKTFSEHLQSIFKDLYQEGRFADVTQVSNDQTQFKAHKIVLSACSPGFTYFDPTQSFSYRTNKSKNSK